ncbi:phosphoglycerate mutase [Trinickia symbiotica]|uniref:Histidine phosphatase family protein n=1 Tax=Trinickia symbiotica TaxID=863227 RepID=A0A2N7WYW4_9BURK|nr:histidine phosphatase family protein [Trinickia symbiotica]PMS34512.1 histidine phosphatase family protein [Trinickia symbiotica]PPK43149.1 phosphoglycerate mutase [Trinickia symbiotica]
MTTRVLFIRHGETTWNRVKRIQGHIDIPLAASGLAQAERLAARLASRMNGRQPARPSQSACEARSVGAIEAQPPRSVLDAIYSSDLQRAQQTAQPTASALGLPLQLCTGLRERAYGVFQGHDSGEIAARFPDAYAVWQTRDPGFAPDGGESSRGFFHRVLHAVASIVAAHPGGHIACVTHGGVLDCIYRHARGLSLEAPRDYPLLNASINTVDFDEAGRASIVAWADVEHLHGESEDDGLSPASAASR